MCFLARFIGFIVLFIKISGKEGVLWLEFIFFTPEWNLFKFMGEISWCMFGLWLIVVLLVCSTLIYVLINFCNKQMFRVYVHVCNKLWLFWCAWFFSNPLIVKKTRKQQKICLFSVIDEVWWCRQRLNHVMFILNSWDLAENVIKLIIHWFEDDWGLFDIKSNWCWFVILLNLNLYRNNYS